METIPEDIADAFKPRMRWHWVNVPNRGRVENVVLETTSGKVTRLDFTGEADRQEVLAALVESRRKRRQRRKESARRGVETRNRRRASQDYAVAKAIVEGLFTPQPWCACCKRMLSDGESVNRGVGSECWNAIKGIIDRMKIEADPEFIAAGVEITDADWEAYGSASTGG